MNKTSSTKKIPLVFGIIAFLVFIFGIKLIDAETNIEMALLRFGLSIVMIVIMLPGIGLLNLKFSKQGWKETFKLTKIVLIVSAIISIVLFAVTLLSYTGGIASYEVFPSSEWLKNALSLALLYVSVGIAEELAFRQALYVCIREQFKSKKNIRIIAAIVSSIVFGFVHVMTNLSLDPLAIISALLKTIECGLFGYFLCAALEQNGNIWPLAAVHALNDFIFSINNIFLNVERFSYVADSSNMIKGVAMCVMYTVFILIYIPTCKKVTKIIRNSDINN